MKKSSPIEVFEALAPAPLTEFGAFFSSFASSAFRLEMLPAYRVPGEAAALAAHQAGHANPDPQFNADWHSVLKAAQEGGKTVRRLRILSSADQEQLTPYERFELEWGYPDSRRHGEQIVLATAEVQDRLASLLPCVLDFWLFDEAHGFFMFYDNLGQFLGASRIPASIIEDYRRLAVSADTFAR